LPSNPEVVRGEWQWPGSVSIDAGRDARADIELWRMGLATAAELYGEAGHDWQASMRQRAKEAAYIRELSVEMDVTPAEISSGIESVATDPNRAPVETPVIDGAQTIEDAASSAQNIDETALNGAQVQALLELAQSVASGVIPIESAKGIAAAAFPLLSQEIVNRIFDSIEPGEITPDQIREAAGEAQFSAIRNFAPEKYAHIDFKPSEALAKEAALGLEWRAEYNRGGTEVGVARARDLSNRTNLSPETVRRMNSYFARHEVDKQGEGFTPGEDGFPSAGRIAWALWGGDAGQSWASARAAQMDTADEGEG
jgi:capsid protein